MLRQCALITGASMGLGEEFARQIAARGMNLLLTARSRDRLEALAEDLRTRFAVKVEVFCCDLAELGAAQRIVEWVDGVPEEMQPHWLINNAGFGDVGPFERIPVDRACATAQVNMVAPTELILRLLPRLKQAPRGTARIINLGSVAAFQPIPYFGVYAATKAYLLSLSEALAEELGRDYGIRVTCVCPGPVTTQFGINNKIDEVLFKGGQRAEDVVRMSLRASDRGQVVLMTSNRLRTFSLRLAPRVLVRKITARIVRAYARKTGHEL